MSGQVLKVAEALHSKGGNNGLDDEALEELNARLLVEANWIHNQSRNALFSLRLRRELAARLARLPDRVASTAALNCLSDIPIDAMVHGFAEEIVAERDLHAHAEHGL